MRYWIDFKALRGALSFAKVLERYKVTLKQKGDQWTGPCPLPDHQGDRKTDSFSANVAKGIFQCFSCHAKGNVFDFAVLMERRNPKNAQDLRQTAIELAKDFQLQHVGSEQKSDRRQNRQVREEQASTQSPPPEPQVKGKVVVNAPLGFELRDLDPTHPYLRSRGLEAATIERFGLGFCARGKFAGRIAIPIHDLAGCLVAYGGRLVDDALITPENPKYLFPGPRTKADTTFEFKKSHLVYNANRLQAPVKSLIIVEGFASVWWLFQNGLTDCVALMGSTLSSEQAKIIERLVARDGHITALLDADAPGLRGADEITAKLAGNITVHRPLMRLGAQPTDLSKEELLALVAKGPASAKSTNTNGHLTKERRICELVAAFPCLAPLNITPEHWDAERFEDLSLKLSSGERAAAQFVLSVWNPNTKWKCGAFDLVDAASRLDLKHRQPIISWFERPWWP